MTRGITGIVTDVIMVTGVVPTVYKISPFLDLIPFPVPLISSNLDSMLREACGMRLVVVEWPA